MRPTRFVPIAFILLFLVALSSWILLMLILLYSTGELIKAVATVWEIAQLCQNNADVNLATRPEIALLCQYK